jgi:hypothetical protein
MPKVFVSYRRDDSGYPAQQIYEVLAKHFGTESIVFDIDTIPLGADFRKYLNDQVGQCDILLAVIGDQWLDILNKRLDDPNDFVRIEIQAALERDIPVVPVLVGKAAVPSSQKLPPELAKLAYKQAAEVRAGADLKAHLKRLIDGLHHLFATMEDEEEKRKQAAEKERRRMQEEDQRQKEAATKRKAEKAERKQKAAAEARANQTRIAQSEGAQTAAPLSLPKRHGLYHPG